MHYESMFLRKSKTKTQTQHPVEYQTDTASFRPCPKQPVTKFTQPIIQIIIVQTLKVWTEGTCF